MNLDLYLDSDYSINIEKIKSRLLLISHLVSASAILYKKQQRHRRTHEQTLTTIDKNSLKAKEIQDKIIKYNASIYKLYYIPYNIKPELSTLNDIIKSREINAIGIEKNLSLIDTILNGYRDSTEYHLRDATDWMLGKCDYVIWKRDTPYGTFHVTIHEVINGMFDVNISHDNNNIELKIQYVDLQTAIDDIVYASGSYSIFESKSHPRIIIINKSFAKIILE